MKSSSNKQGSQANDLLRRWLASEAETQEVQQAAQEDAFLRDALEGYQAFAKNDQAERLTQLRAKLQDRYQQKPKRRVLFYLPRIAAAIVLLMAVGWWWTTLSNDTPSETIAEQTSPTTEERPESSQLQRKGGDVITPPAEMEEEASELTQDEPAPVPETKTTQRTSDILAQAESTKSNEQATTEDEGISQPLSDAAEKAVEQPDMALQKEATPQEFSTETVPRRPLMKSTNSESDNSHIAARSAVPQRFVQGVVVDEQGQPVDGATVIANEQAATITDTQGRFGLTVPPRESLLTINYSGYVEKKVPFSTQDSLAIVLNQLETKLNKNGVSTYTQTNTQATPIGGYHEFQTYIKNNLRYPQAAKTATVQDTIPVYFTVLPDGSVTDVRVPADEQDNYGLAEEAIRLIKEGPKWNSNGQRVKDVRYEIVFEQE